MNNPARLPFAIASASTPRSLLARVVRTLTTVPLYEYRCTTCDERFEARRPIGEADAPARCPSGHDSSVRLLAAFAATGRASGSAEAEAAMPAGPCGGNCACYRE